MWSLLGIRLAYGLGGPLSAESIFGKLGMVGNAAAYAVVAIDSLLMSAFGETMYVSRWLSGGTARARRQYTRWLARTWMSLREMPDRAETWANVFVGLDERM